MEKYNFQDLLKEELIIYFDLEVDIMFCSELHSELDSELSSELNSELNLELYSAIL